jgi:tRNA-dihydrouridine synthase
MKDQDTSEQVVNAMVSTSQLLLDKPIPISVKCRIGIDEHDTFEFISNYISRLSNVGCTNFIIHARKVYMQGLDPAANRTIPPLNYPIVYKLMKEYPGCNFIHNGGIRSLVHARELAFGSCVKFDDNGKGRAEPKSGYESDSEHVIPCQQCNLPQGSCLHPPRTSPPNMKGVMVARLARDRPADLADVDRYFYGEPCNPCVNRRQLMDRYIDFLEQIYPRRCCDNDETISLDMMRDMSRPILPLRSCCNICRGFRGCPNGEEECRPIISIPQTNASENSEVSTNNRMPQPRKQSGKRSKRHDKYGGAKIVTRIIDRALQPTWNILAGEKGKRVFVNTSHELSRDKTVRNCGPAYILWKAMKAVPDEIWDKPFELSDEKRTSYYPTK